MSLPLTSLCQVGRDQPITTPKYASPKVGLYFHLQVEVTSSIVQALS